MLRRFRRGANAMEFALVSPLLFMSIFSVFECGWFFCNQVVLDELVSDMSRAISTAPAEDIAVVYDEEIIIATERWRSMGLMGTPIFQYATFGTSVSVQGEVTYEQLGPYNILTIDEIRSEVTTTWPGGAP